MWLFNWMKDNKIRTINPFWAHVALVKDDNTKKVVAKADGKTAIYRNSQV